MEPPTKKVKLDEPIDLAEEPVQVSTLNEMQALLDAKTRVFSSEEEVAEFFFDSTKKFMTTSATPSPDVVIKKPPRITDKLRKADIIDHLLSVLSDLNWESTECYHCGWIDHADSFVRCVFCTYARICRKCASAGVPLTMTEKKIRRFKSGTSQDDLETSVRESAAQDANVVTCNQCKCNTSGIWLDAKMAPGQRTPCYVSKKSIRAKFPEEAAGSDDKEEVW